MRPQPFHVARDVTLSIARSVVLLVLQWGYNKVGQEWPADILRTAYGASQLLALVSALYISTRIKALASTTETVTCKTKQPTGPCVHGKSLLCASTWTYVMAAITPLSTKPAAGAGRRWRPCPLGTTIRRS